MANKEVLGRRDITSILTEATLDHWTKLRFSAFKEIGFIRWGKKRADVLALNLKGHLVACEIKSCIADYRADQKVWSYRNYVNQLYLIFDHLTYSKHKSTLDLDCKMHNAGIMILDPKTGYLRTKIRCPKTSVDPASAYNLILRCAWRAGESKRVRTRRTRRYINKDS